MPEQLVYSQVEWSKNGVPRSVQFDDFYFCTENGLYESQYVFCEGNNLKERWQYTSDTSQTTFTIGEIGFGSGLNFLCTWQLWQKYAPKNWILHYISIDQFPLRAEDFYQARDLWTEFKDLSDALGKQYDRLIHK